MARGQSQGRSLSRELEEAVGRCKRATKALAKKYTDRERVEFRAALESRLQLERDLARERSEEVAVPLDWQLAWDTGAPLPHVVSSGSKTSLIYLVSEPDPNWDGSNVNVIDPSAAAVELLAIVEFKRCYAYQFGGPNDEVFAGHPLTGRGLAGYGAYLVENSKWIREMIRINSVHHRYDESLWSDYRHYFLAFHDECFECIAVGHRVKKMQCSFAMALEQACKNVISSA